MSVATLIDQWRQQDRLALARLLTVVGRGEHLDEIRAAIRGLPPKQYRVIAVTGSAGVGKSTLIGGLLEVLRERGEQVAVLACDPESPLTGGALLGDRLRMPVRSDDPGVFIRSIAAPGGGQAIGQHLRLMINLLIGFGFGTVLLETVGAGQGDTAVRQVADVVVLLVQPEAGDDVQWEKAGLLEVADVVVVHKADLPGADRTEGQVRSLLNLPGSREVPIVRVSSAKKTGWKELVELLATLPSLRLAPRHDAHTLLRLTLELLADRFHERGKAWQSIAADWEQEKLDDAQAAAAVLEKLAGGS
jgi:LAO/AO transport system ATPase